MKNYFNRISAALSVLTILLTGCGVPKTSDNKADKEKDRPAYYEEYGFKDDEDTLAFLGADGFGKETVGGRGGKVYHVTILKYLFKSERDLTRNY